jgi:hypothetical protein
MNKPEGFGHSQMDVRRWRRLILFPWVSLPLVAGIYVALWDRLPERLTVQVSTSGEPTNTMSRGVLLAFETALLAFVLANYSFRLWGRRREDSKKLIITYYIAVVIVTAVFLWILKHNL